MIHGIELDQHVWHRRMSDASDVLIASSVGLLETYSPGFGCQIAGHLRNAAQMKASPHLE